ncbi:hypothetical protein [Streptomyces noursei]|uniref:Uncharacterized protein n=1 Tax=Streptomyces noursei TaxID=1971 RepID=A0A2N8PQV2_STRNR|nr:hypothetical protein [Streptomyces noursei]PNE43410.1 hypothetical protein AOB60_00225 [Streptomyces noursei]
MTNSSNALPDKWTIRLHPTLNLLVLSLLDAGGIERQRSYHMTRTPAAVPSTVHDLDEITDAELRGSATALIDRYFERLARVRENADAFSKAVPNWFGLVARLRRAVPDVQISTDLDHDDLALRMTLTATGPASGHLLTLIASWPCSATADGPTDGVTRGLDETGNVTVALEQEPAIAFLTWFREQSRAAAQNGLAVAEHGEADLDDYRFPVSAYAKAALVYLGEGWDGDSGFIGNDGRIWGPTWRTILISVTEDFDGVPDLTVRWADDPDGLAVAVDLPNGAASTRADLRAIGQQIADIIRAKFSDS